jgi:hypothetical protein
MYTSQANYLIYVVMHPEDVDGLGMAYVTEPKALRVWIDDWAERYREVQVKNKGFQGRGILVPLRELERVSVKKLLVN